MATYKEIKGVTVQTRDEDPVLAGVAGATWSSGGSINTARNPDGGYAGTQTANLIFGGEPAVGNTEQYDGTTWTEKSDLNTARRSVGGVGTYTAAFGAGGRTSTTNVGNHEQWDGSSWTETTDLNTAKEGRAGYGIQTAGAVVGGSPQTAINEYWNGSSWTEVGDIPGVRYGLCSGGTYTAAIACVGEKNPPTPKETNEAFTWDSSSWTEVADVNTPRTGTFCGNGTQTDFLMAGGTKPSNSPAVTALTEHWNGTSWTEVADLATAVRGQGGGGSGSSATAAISSGGTPGPAPNGHAAATEEFNAAPVTQDKLVEGMLFLSGGTTLKGFGKAAGIPAATWASSGNLNQARNILDAQNGTQSSSKASGGSPPGTAGLANVEDYDGSSWSETTEMNTPRYSAAAAGASNTSALVFSGYNNSSPLASPGGYLSATESWNGSAWTEVNDLNIKMSNRSGNGIQTSALCYGGYESPYALTESWDGTNWTEVSDLNTGRMDLGGIGDSNTSALAFGGLVAPNTKSDKTESWNGTSWTEVNDLNTNRAYVGGSGSRDLAIAFGGETPPLRANTEAWNGTSWTEINDLSTARKSMGSSGSAAAGLAAGGNDGSTVLTATEEFTASLSNKTITAS